MGSSAPRSAGQPILPPGFRFHPTDEELVIHYLKLKAASRPLPVSIIAEIDLYKFDPWDLPGKASFGEHEWYFFSPRDRKYPNGARPNRAAASGYWKATGTDKPITTGAGNQKVGVKKALVFYRGRPPKGIKTNWIMHEYRLTESGSRPTSFSARKSLRLDDWVLCRIYKKNTQATKIVSRDGENSSCVEEVLASLPDIEDPKLGILPRLGSFSALGDTEPFFENFLSEPEATASNSAGSLPHMDVPRPYSIPHRLIRGNFNPADLSIVTRYALPPSTGSYPKSELVEMDAGKLDMSAFIKVPSENLREDDFLSTRNLFSLPNLTRMNTYQHSKSQIAPGDGETSYKWFFEDKSQF